MGVLLPGMGAVATTLVAGVHLIHKGLARPFGSLTQMQSLRLGKRTQPRWKPIHEQPIGWNPDLNDGVRMNIRPFVAAGVLRKNPNIKWTKDRGNEPQRDKAAFPWFWDGDRFTGARVNDVHLMNVQKQVARR